MTTRQPVWCFYCKHWIGNGECRAFPDGIPEPILDGAPHSSPVDGDNGIMFALDSRKRSMFDNDQPFLQTAVETVG